MSIPLPLPDLDLDFDEDAAGVEAEEVEYFLAYFERIEIFLKSSEASDSEVKGRPIMQSSPEKVWKKVRS